MGSRINSFSLRINGFNVCMRMQLGVGVLVLVTPTPLYIDSGTGSKSP